MNKYKLYNSSKNKLNNYSDDYYNLQELTSHKKEPYVFTISATNSIGDSQLTDPTANVIPNTVPSAPIISSVTAVKGYLNNAEVCNNGKAVKVIITPPTYTGGNPITTYTITATPPSGTPITKTINSNTNNIYYVDELTNGVSYTFTSTATNLSGTSVPSTGVIAIPVGNGKPITNSNFSNIILGDTVIKFTFTPPVEDNTSSNPIIYTPYIFDYNSGNVYIGSLEVIKSNGVYNITKNGAINGNIHIIGVYSRNGFGCDYADTSYSDSTGTNQFRLVGKPSSPTNIVASQLNNNASVSFVVPTNTGGSPITNYTVKAYDGTISTISATGTSSPITITGLTIGKPYTFRVIANNSQYSSVESSDSNSITIITIPDPPTNVIATYNIIGNNWSVSFVVPTNTGGSPIINYKVKAYDGAISTFSATGTSSPISISGLTIGKTYTFKVIATNTRGDSLESISSNSVTTNVPNKITGVSLIPDTNKIKLSFTVPENNGSPITKLNIKSYYNDPTNTSNYLYETISIDPPTTGLTAGQTKTISLNTDKAYNLNSSLLPSGKTGFNQLTNTEFNNLFSSNLSEKTTNKSITTGTFEPYSYVKLNRNKPKYNYNILFVIIFVVLGIFIYWLNNSKKKKIKISKN